MVMMRKPRIFVSSTIYDFKDLRSALKKYIEKEILLDEELQDKGEGIETITKQSSTIIKNSELIFNFGNNKDSIEDVPHFIEKLEEGYDLIQGSRFVKGGKAVNTPFIRTVSVKLIHAPIISLTAHQRFTDTTNAYRAYSVRYLSDERVQPLRDTFMTYELLAYLSVRATQIGMKACEIPVTRAYPKTGKTPTKISFFKGNSELMKILLKNARGAYNPK